MSKICILVAAYNEEEVLRTFYDETIKVINSIDNYDFEILFVSDGSTDNTISIMKELRSEDKRVSYLKLSRNYGKEISVYAGLNYVGDDVDAVIFMDADLQDPPSLIPELIANWEKGYDDVYAKRRKRAGETFFKKFTSKMYYRIVSTFSDIPVDVDTGDFRIIDRRCINILKKMPEKSRNSRNLFNYIGYNKKAVLFDREERAAGETKFSLSKMMNLAIEGIIGSGTKLIRMILKVAEIFALLTLILFIAYIVTSIIKGHNSELLMYTIMTLFATIIISLIWLIGEYIGTIYKEVKIRPTYLVDEYNGVREDNSDSFNANNSEDD